MEFGEALKSAQGLVKSLKALTETGLEPAKHAEALDGLAAALRDFLQRLPPAEVEAESRTLAEALESQLSSRREELLREAKSQGIPYRRYEGYDRVGPFKLTYSGKKKLRVELGSEWVEDLEEPRGAELFQKIMALQKQLESRPFDREVFFKQLKTAYRLASEGAADGDGWVPVRRVYACLSLVRNSQVEAFLQQPEKKHFEEYSTVAFVYDLARFGKDSWSSGQDSVQTRTPNMATLSAKGKSFTLPNLVEAEGNGPQLAVLRIRPRE